MKSAKNFDAPDPQLETVQEVSSDRRLGWWTVLALGLALLTITTYLVLRSIVGSLEENTFRFFYGWPDSWRSIFLVVTISPEPLWIAMGTMFVTFAVRLYRAAWELAVATLCGSAAVFLGKHIIDRPRPEGLFGDVTPRVHETGMAFPSGHTMIITVIVLVLFPYLPKGWRWLALLLIPMVAIARMYLGVHMPLDVVGGLAVGVVVVAAMRSLPGPMRRWLHFS
jgi:undecaprenyl-diphosphatase